MQKSTASNLLAEFPPASYAEWKEAAEKLLKGAPFEKKLFTKTVEGITLAPIYRRDDRQSRHDSSQAPGTPGSRRGHRPVGYLQNCWQLAQELGEGHPQAFNKVLLSDLTRGQNSVFIRVDAATANGLNPADASDAEVGYCGLSLSTREDFSTALKDVIPEAVTLLIDPGFAGLPVAELLADWSAISGNDKLRGALFFDPLARLAAVGSMPYGTTAALDQTSVLYGLGQKLLPGMKTLHTNGLVFHAAGGSAVDELAGVLALGSTYLHELSGRGVDLNAAAGAFSAALSLGGNFFMELAKIRAFRLLWPKLLNAYGVKDAPAPWLHVRTGWFNKTVTDPYVNMLRTTTEALSGVLGGIDSMTVGAFDEVIRLPNEFSRRIARNTQIILAEECELTRVIDPAGGSWYLESLTDELAAKAWAGFQEIEKAGGFVKALESGLIAQKCAASRDEASRRLGQRRASLIGTNVYANVTEVPLDKDPADPASIRAARIKETKDLSDTKTVGELARALGFGEKPCHIDQPIRPTRLGLAYEKLREAARAAKPGLFLVNLGPLRKHKLRADYIRGFFEPGGFEVIYPNGFEEAAAAVQALRKSKAKVAVVCGSDDQYPELFPAFASAIKEAIPECLVALAGAPGDNEEVFRAAGMDIAVNIRSEHYATVRDFLAHAGVKTA